MLNYNLLTHEGVILRTWELGAEYQEKIYAVFPNEIEKINNGELIVYIGILPKSFKIEDGKVVEIIFIEHEGGEGFGSDFGQI